MPSISVPVGAALTSGLGALGVGAETAGMIGSVAAPILTNAGLGAGVSGLMGKNMGQGALMGGVLGGLGEFSPGGALNGALGGNAQGAPISNAYAQPGASAGGPDNASAVPGTYAGGNSLAPGGALTQASSQAAGGPSAISKTLANLMALGQMQAQQRPAQQQPANFNTPLNPTGYINRSMNQNYQPAGGDWQHWGESPQAQFYSGNQITGYAHGGALSQMQPVSTGRGQHYVEGGSGGQSDLRPALLSDGEFIFDSATVSRLGGGNSEAGAKKLEAMRKAIAHDAGAKKVVQGKVKSPLQYVAEVRRAGGK